MPFETHCDDTPKGPDEATFEQRVPSGGIVSIADQILAQPVKTPISFRAVRKRLEQRECPATNIFILNPP